MIHTHSDTALKKATRCALDMYVETVYDYYIDYTALLIGDGISKILYEIMQYAQRVSMCGYGSFTNDCDVAFIFERRYADDVNIFDLNALRANGLPDFGKDLYDVLVRVNKLDHLTLIHMNNVENTREEILNDLNLFDSNYFIPAEYINPLAYSNSDSVGDIILTNNEDASVIARLKGLYVKTLKIEKQRVIMPY